MRTRTLILLRHGKSDYPGGVVDHDRPLAARGKHEADLAGEWLRAGRWADATDRTPPPTIGAVLCSTAARARQTLRHTEVDAPAEFMPELYGATAEEIIDVVRGVHDDVDSLLVVGHAPGLPDTATALAGPDSDRDAVAALERGFPTSAIAVITVPGRWAALDPEATALRRLHVPRD
jgi:phosphohistidine phosphatase